MLQQSQAEVLDVQNWHEFLKTIVSAGYKKNEMISSEVGLFYSYAFYLIGKNEFLIDLKTNIKIEFEGRVYRSKSND